MYDLKVRNIPEDVSAKLKMEAKKQGIGLETYVRNLLRDFSLRPEKAQTEDKYVALVKDTTNLYRSIIRETTDCLERNMDLMEQILTKLERG